MSNDGTGGVADTGGNMDDGTKDDELVSQFMSFTGSADPGSASSYLEMSGGNLETAVSLYMEHQTGVGGGGFGGNGGGGGGLGGVLADAAAVGGMGGGMGRDGDIRAPDATRTMRLMDDNVGMPAADPSLGLMNAMMEEQLAQTAFASPSAPRATGSAQFDARAAVNAAAAAALASHPDLGGADSDLDDDDEHFSDSGDEGNGRGGNADDDDDEVQVLPSASSSSMGASAGQPARLSDMFAPPGHLIHKAGGFQGARAMAKDSKRWLLVNLQRDSEFACHALNRDVWRDELVENLIREGFIFWQQMDTQPEGRTYSERYQVNQFPHVAIIDPRTARLLWRKEGWTQENPMTAETFAEMAMDFCSRNSLDRPPQAPRPTAPGATSSFTRPSKRAMHEMSEDEQLQAAMRASMEEAANEDGSVEVEYISSEDDKDESSKLKAEDKAPSFVDELLAMTVADAPASGGARVQLRMPDGKRVVRAFPPTEPVKMIYAHVAQSSEEARGGREFVLMAGFPPNDLVNDIDNTIQACNLAGQAVTVRWK